MSYLRKSYGYAANGKQTAFAGHIRKQTAIKRGFKSVTLTAIDMSGKGRGATSRHYAPAFEGMRD